MNLLLIPRNTIVSLIEVDRVGIIFKVSFPVLKIEENDKNK